MDIREGLKDLIFRSVMELLCGEPIVLDDGEVPNSLYGYVTADRLIDYLTEQGVGVLKRYTAVDPGFGMERAQETALVSSERFISLKEYIEKHG